MSEQHERLRLAREKAGYATPEAAIEALGVKAPTYYHHENGTNGLSRAGKRYAQFFNVNLEWLLTGNGPMRGSGPRSIPVTGTVGAGAHVARYPKQETKEEIELPGPKTLGALEVVGDSMYPRFYPGEFILYNIEMEPAATLVNQYAICETMTGETLIKILREGRVPGVYTLESHNHPPIKDVELFYVNRVVGVITDNELLLPEKRKRR